MHIVASVPWLGSPVYVLYTRRRCHGCETVCTAVVQLEVFVKHLCRDILCQYVCWVVMCADLVY